MRSRVCGVLKRDAPCGNTNAPLAIRAKTWETRMPAAIVTPTATLPQIHEMEQKMKRSYLMFLLGIAFAVPLRAAPIGAVAQVGHYDSQTNLVTIEIVNTSHKDITAYNVYLTETYVSGRVFKHELMTDLAGTLAVIQEMQGTANEENLRKSVGDGVLHPGASRKEIIPVQPGLQNLEAVVDVVAYNDQTAEATNNDALQRLVSHRKVMVATRQAANDIIKAALADPNDSNPAATAAKKIQDQSNAWKTQTYHATIDFEPGVADGIVGELKGISQQFIGKRTALAEFLDKSQKRITILSPHANLTKIGEQP